MQSFVGKLTHVCPVYYCSRSARPRALPAGLSTHNLASEPSRVSGAAVGIRNRYTGYPLIDKCRTVGPGLRAGWLESRQIHLLPVPGGLQVTSYQLFASDLLGANQRAATPASSPSLPSSRSHDSSTVSFGGPFGFTTGTQPPRGFFLASMYTSATAARFRLPCW